MPGYLDELVSVGNNNSFGENTPMDRQRKIVKEGTQIFEESFRSKYTSLGKMFESNDPREVQLASTTAIIMHNQERFIEQMKLKYGETTVMQNLGDLGSRTVEVVRVFFPNMIANLIAELQPMTSQTGDILTIKPIFSNSRSGVKKGDEAFINPTNGNYASDRETEIVGTGDGSTTNYSGTLSLVPLRPGTITIYSGGQAVASDDGEGTIKGNGVTGSVGYATGAYDVTFTTAPTVGVALTIEYRYDIEESPDTIPELEIAMNLVPIQAKMHPLRVSWSVASQLAAAAQYNLDVEDTVSNLAGQFIKKERDDLVVQKIVNAAPSYADLDFDATVSGDLTKRNHFQDFSLKITRAESIIFNASKRGNVSFILAGINASDVVSAQSNFIPEPRTVPIGAHKIGTIDGAIDVIKDASMDPNTYVFGFRGMLTGDAALIVGEWIPIYFTPTFQNSNLRNSQGLFSMYDTLLNNAQYYAKGKLTNYSA